MTEGKVDKLYSSEWQNVYNISVQLQFQLQHGMIVDNAL